MISIVDMHVISSHRVLIVTVRSVIIVSFFMLSYQCSHPFFASMQILGVVHSGDRTVQLKQLPQLYLRLLHLLNQMKMLYSLLSCTCGVECHDKFIICMYRYMQLT